MEEPRALGNEQVQFTPLDILEEEKILQEQEKSTKFKQKLDVPIPATPLPLGWTPPMLGDEAQHPGRRDTDLKEMRVGITPGRSDRNFPDTAGHWVSQEERAFPTQQ